MLRGNNITCSRGDIILFSDLSFSLKPGERLAIKGANGSGKSTFLRLLTGLIPLERNRLFWKGEMVSQSNLTLYQQNLLYAGHKLCLHSEVRVVDQVKLWEHQYKIHEKVIVEALESWGLGSRHQKISHLSQGQQKRLSLSRCSWLKRSLWILDEPEESLDDEGQQKLDNILKNHLERGGSVVHGTHDPRPSSLELFL